MTPQEERSGVTPQVKRSGVKLREGLPVRVPGCYGAARVVCKIRGYGVVLLDRKVGMYWTYQPRQLRPLTDWELRAFVKIETRKEVER